jgi:hypothetical protein
VFFFEGIARPQKYPGQRSRGDVTPFSVFNLAANFGIVISGSASTHLIRAVRYGASLPPRADDPAVPAPPIPSAILAPPA